MGTNNAYFSILFTDGVVDPLRFYEYSDWTTDKITNTSITLATTSLKSDSKVRWDAIGRLLADMGGVIHTSHKATGGNASTLPTDVTMIVGFHNATDLFDALIPDDYVAHPDTQGRPAYDEVVLVAAMTASINKKLAGFTDEAGNNIFVESFQHEALTNPLRRSYSAAAPAPSSSVVPVTANYVGDGTQTVFFVPNAIASNTASCFVEVGGVPQQPEIDFTNVNGTVTLTVAPIVDMPVAIHIIVNSVDDNARIQNAAVTNSAPVPSTQFWQLGVSYDDVPVVAGTVTVTASDIPPVTFS